MLKLDDNKKRIVLKIFIISILSIVVLIALVILKDKIYGNHANMVKNEDMKVDRVNKNRTINKEDIKEIVSDRYIKIVEGDNDELSIKIGNNLKEIENDYYDISFHVYTENETNNGNDKFRVYINKLWKNMESTDMQLLYEEEYVKEIVNVFEKILYCKFSNNEKELIYQFITDNYDYVRNKSHISNIDINNIQQKINIKGYVFKADSEENKLFIDVK